jgi:serine/threonine-protein kinase HipA
MGRKSHSKQLYCSMNNVLVGTLKLTKGRMSFQYDSQWLTAIGTRALSLSLPLQSSEIKSDAVHAYFDNLLPDNDVIRKHMVDRLGAQSTSPFDLLATVGGDCIGAISLTHQPPAGSLPDMSLKPVSEVDIAQTIRDTRVDNVLGMHSDDDFRISLAGAQEKTALTLWKGQWHKPQGKTATTHIFKPPIFHHQQMNIDLSSSVDNEWFCLTFLANLGLPVAKVDIQTFEDQRVLVVERFDRRITDSQIVRLPQEDMCQALAMVSGSKYEENGGPGAFAIMDLLKRSSSAIQDRYHFMMSQIVFWLLGAIDGHAKNFSIFLQADGYRLTPLYDVMSAYPYFGQGNVQKQKIKMAMKVHSKNTHYHWYNIQKRHWFAHGKYLGLGTEVVQSIIDHLFNKTEQALDNTFKLAPQDFNKEMGHAIAEKTRQCLKKLI